MVGTESGAPIPIPERGFIRDGDEIVLSRASLTELEATARRSGGDALVMTTADQDIRQLQLRAEDHHQWQETSQERTTTRRQDDGYWLLWLALPLALLGWRRGALTVGVAVSLSTTNAGQRTDWDSLWQTLEQRAPELIREDPANAASNSQIRYGKAQRCIAMNSMKQPQMHLPTTTAPRLITIVVCT